MHHARDWTESIARLKTRNWMTYNSRQLKKRRTVEESVQSKHRHKHSISVGHLCTRKDETIQTSTKEVVFLHTFLDCGLVPRVRGGEPQHYTSVVRLTISVEVRLVGLPSSSCFSTKLNRCWLCSSCKCRWSG